MSIPDVLLVMMGCSNTTSESDSSELLKRWPMSAPNGSRMDVMSKNRCLSLMAGVSAWTLIEEATFAGSALLSLKEQ
jgi:hypothetical protein